MISVWVFVIFAGLYAWQVHGWSFGILAALSMFVFTIIVNTVYMRRSLEHENSEPNKMIKHFQIIKWIIFIVIMLTIAITGAEFVSIQNVN